MSDPKYSINDEPVSALLSWIRSGDIAIPEIQRPFVWKPSKVRDLLDSLLKGYPVGYMIVWRNPDVQLKDGQKSTGKRILIDGQQRMTALMAALLGYEIVTKQYEKRRIQISYHPLERTFEVFNSAIAKDPAWIPDIKTVFEPTFDSYTFVNEYVARHPEVNPSEVNSSINALAQIKSNPMGLIELSHDLTIETVTEIFIRVNSAGVTLNQADFAMSKIAVNVQFDGPNLRKAIDYFCHLAKKPETYGQIERDTDFVNSQYFSKLRWLRKENDDLYDPQYTDMLRVAFAKEFGRGRLQDLVALLSGRNFETEQYEQAIVEDTFERLRQGVLDFMNETHFNRFVMIIRSAGFVSSSLIGSQMALNFAYILYLTLRNQGLDNAEIERHVRRWYVMSVLTGRYSGSFETTIGQDMNRIYQMGIDAYADAIIRSTLSEAFWDSTLPRQLNTSSSSSPNFHVFRAAQVKLNDLGFLSRDITIRELVSHKSDVHHVFPKDVLKKAGMASGQYNQIANYVITQTEINIAIGNKPPNVYFKQLLEQSNGGGRRVYGNIATREELEQNLTMNCIPQGIENMGVEDYPAFLDARRHLMAQKIRTYFETL